MIGDKFKLIWTKLPNLPDPEGFAGSYAGWSNGFLLVTGGSNFPEKPMWEGGKKIWSKTVWGWLPEINDWIELGELPFAYGYGASISVDGALYCIGGCDETGHRNDVLKLECLDEILHVSAIHPLPHTLANHCAARVGSHILVCGGSLKPGEQDASNDLWMLDLKHPHKPWEKLPSLPAEGRFLAFAGSTENESGEFYIFGGIGLTPNADGKGFSRKMLTDAWKFNLKSKTWTKLKDLPGPQAAGPTPVQYDAKGAMWLLGGDNGSRAGFTPVQEHPGFAPVIRRYDVAKDEWTQSLLAEDCLAPRAVLPFVPAPKFCCCGCGGKALGILAGGELRPGKRSNELYRVRVADSE